MNFTAECAAAVVAITFAALTADGQDKTPLDTARIEQLTGAKGTLDEKEGVFKVSVPRTDLKVTTAGVKMTPPLGLTSWAAFKSVGDHVVVMGDTVMTEDQVNAVMSVALENGLEVTALHNHFFWDSPKVMFMHIGGIGDAEKLAAAVGKVLAKIKETSGAGNVPLAEIDSAQNKLDPQRIDQIFGTTGETAPNGVHKVTIPKTTKMHGHEMGSAMGVNTWAAFAGGDEKAIVDGDFAMYEGELQAVLKALRSGDINVVAIHNHMTHEEPRVVFLHYWGVGKPEELAQKVKAALDAQATADQAQHPAPQPGQPQPHAPAAPKNVRAIKVGAALDVTWDGVGNKYHVQTQYHDTVGDGVGKWGDAAGLNDGEVDQRKYRDTQSPLGQQVRYRVRLSDGKTWSEYSKESEWYKRTAP